MDKPSNTPELKLVHDDEPATDRTHIFVPDQEAAAPASSLPEVEANVILIAHPENQLLGHRYSLPPGAEVVIGRDPNVEISLPEVLSLSRRHSRLEHRAGTVTIEDLGSTNGTFVNDRKALGRTLVKSGDRFQVGTVHFKFLHERDVENAYHEVIYNLTMRDGLTDTYNKRKFDEEYDREMARASRYQRPISLILMDLDHFKVVNDTHGHLCGDRVLKDVAAHMHGSLRREQVFARVGGEEFAILCPETPAAGAARLADKLRAAIAGSPTRFGLQSVRVTCSFGVAERSKSLSSPEELYAAADQALYQAKEAGRNQVVVFSRD